MPSRRSWAGGASPTRRPNSLLGNANVTVRNPGADVAERRLMVGRTDGGRALTLVIEQTIEPSIWLVVTGWTATAPERRMLGD